MVGCDGGKGAVEERILTTRSLWLPIQVAVNRFGFSAFSAATNGTAFEAKKSVFHLRGGRRFLNEVAVLLRRF